MLKLYNRSHSAVGHISQYKSLKIVSEVSDGSRTLSFTYLGQTAIETEYYIETEDDEYVVKEISESMSGYPEITATLNLEELEGTPLKSFSVTDSTISDAARSALTGTGWRLGDCDVVKKRNAGMLQVSVKEALEKLATAFICEIVYDTKNKKVSFYKEVGDDKGVYFTKGLNLKKLTKKSDTYDYYTQIIPIGSDDLTIESVNDGQNYLENYQYSTKKKAYIWKDESYTDATALMEDAELKLDDLSKPIKSYSATVADLAAQNSDYSILSFKVGDRIWLIDSNTGTREKQRIVKLTEYPMSPNKNTCELSNTTMTFEELQQKYKEAADIVNTVISGDGQYTGTVKVSDILNFEDGVSGSATIGGINQSLTALKAKVGTIETNYLTAEEIEADYATIENLTATNATVEKISGDYADFKTVTTDELAAQKAIIDDLDATYVKASTLEANYAKIDLANIEQGCITSAMIGKEAVGTSQIADGSITDAKIVGLTANKITAGTLDAGVIEVINLNAANITVGTINGIQIAAGAIDMTKLGSDVSAWISETDSDVSNALKEAGIANDTAEEVKANAVFSTKVQYALSDSKTTAPTSGWSTTAPAWVDGEYMWQRTVTTYGDGTTDTSDATCISGATGQTGATGAKGATGTGVKGIVPQYYLSTSNTTQTGGSWSSSEPTWASGKYIWTRSYITWSDDTTSYTTAVLANGLNQANSTASSAVSIANGKTAAYYSASAPSGGSYKTNDIWYDTDDGYRMYYYNGSTWTATQFGSNAILAGAITTEKLDASAVTAGKIAAGAVTSDKIYANAVTAGKIATDAVTAGTIAAGAVTTAKLAATAVTAEKIAADAVTTDKIVANAVTAAKIAAETITANEIASNAITADKIKASAVTSTKIEAGAITADKIGSNQIITKTANIADGVITNAKITSLSADKIKTGSIKSTNYSYSSGRYSKKGMAIDLDNAAIIAPNFALTKSGYAYINGQIEANWGKLGNIWCQNGDIISGKIASGYGLTGIFRSDYAFYAGALAIGNTLAEATGDDDLYDPDFMGNTTYEIGNTPSFYVTNDGYAHIKNLNVVTLATEISTKNANYYGTETCIKQIGDTTGWSNLPNTGFGTLLTFSCNSAYAAQFYITNAGAWCRLCANTTSVTSSSSWHSWVKLS